MSVLGRALRDFPFSADGVTVEDVTKGTERPFPPQKVFDGLRDAGFIAAVAAVVAPPVDETPAAPAAPLAPAGEPRPSAEPAAAPVVDGEGGALPSATSDPAHQAEASEGSEPALLLDAAAAGAQTVLSAVGVSPASAGQGAGETGASQAAEATTEPAIDAPEAPTTPSEPVAESPETALAASSAAQKRRGRG